MPLFKRVAFKQKQTTNARGGRYGRKKHAGYRDGKTIGKSEFGGQDICCKVPDGLAYPTAAAFRSMVCFDEAAGKYANIWDLASMTVKRLASGQ